MSKVLRCECGTEITGPDDEELAALATDHARRVHGMQLTRENALTQAVPAAKPAAEPAMDPHETHERHWIHRPEEEQ